MASAILLSFFLLRYSLLIFCSLFYLILVSSFACFFPSSIVFLLSSFSPYSSIFPFSFFDFIYVLLYALLTLGEGGYQMDIQKRLPAYFYAFYTSKSIVLTKLRVLNLSQHLRSMYQSLNLHLEQISLSLLFVLDRCIFFYNLIIMKTRLCLEK